jgi:hypothetical protein
MLVCLVQQRLRFPSAPAHGVFVRDAHLQHRCSIEVPLQYNNDETENPRKH